VSFAAKSTLPRLGREYYQGHAMVLWTHTFEHRASGWLTDKFHTQFREILLHACGRYSLATPCYVLMPDHWHIVWTGLSGGTERSSSDPCAPARGYDGQKRKNSDA
jgi:putative transposase